MRFFKKEEAPKRVEIAGMCHKLMKSLIEKFGEERKIYSSNWVEMFNQGKIEDIETFHKQAKEVVKEQADTVTKLMKMIEEQEKEIEESHDPHLRYSRLVSSFFGKGIDPYKKSKEEVIEILKLLKNLRDVLNMQKQELESEEGPGQEAYGQKRFQELLRQEYQLLKEVQPFWHDWEVLADRLLKVLDPRNEIDEDEWKRVVSDIESYLKQYHAEYSDNGRAAQIGTELAINLFLNSKMKNIPVTIVNIDMTHCNNLDKSHKLGNVLVILGY